jgi:hypothetical protein
MKAFRRAAQTAFERAYAGLSGRPAEVERITTEVELDGQRESVTLSLHDGALSWSCSCGNQGCAHAQAALAFLSDADPPPVRKSSLSTPRFSLGPSRDRRTLVQADAAVRADPGVLAGILEDLITAVVRSGADAGLSPSIEEGLARLRIAAPSPVPLGVSRWAGRLKQAISDREPDELARVLAGANRLIDDLRAATPSADARRSLLSWLGSRGNDTLGTVRATDLTLLEIAREWLPGFERAGVERRYLLDLGDGQLYREERALGAQTASLGPCPRLLTVWLAIVEQGAPPKAIHLLQYAVTPAIEPGVWERTAEHALRGFRTLIDIYREALSSFPGLSEPFVTLAPSRIGDASLGDAEGFVLPLRCAESPAVLRHLWSMAQGAEPLFVAGRLVDRDGLIGLLPLSAAVKRHGRVCYEQL